MKHLLKNKTLWVCMQMMCMLNALLCLIHQPVSAPVAPNAPSFVLLFLASTFALAFNISQGNHLKTQGKRAVVLVNAFAVILALVLSLYHYRLYLTASTTSNIFAMTFVPLGVYFAFFNILLCVLSNLPRLSWQHGKVNANPIKVFWLAWLTLSAAYLIVFFVAKFPGTLSVDSLASISQIQTGVFSNHHPFYYTALVHIAYTVGMALFHNVYGAIAVYMVAQMLFCTFVLALALATLARSFAPKWVLWLVFLNFLTLPYYRAYAMTMWKDVPFSFACLLLVVALWRLFQQQGKPWFNYLCLVGSALVIALVRHNGFLLLVLFTLGFVALFKFKHKAMLLALVVVLAASFVLNKPVIKHLNIKPVDVVEYLHIPTQQLARDLVEHTDFDTSDILLLNRVANVGEIKKLYNLESTNDINAHIRQREGALHFIKTHKMELLSLWVKRLIKHPLGYLYAYLDQTRGYLNGGYTFWRWMDMVWWHSDYGLVRMPLSESVNNAIKAYDSAFETLPPLTLFLSIGLYNWLMLLVLCVALIQKNKALALLTLPSLLTLLSLLLAAPVFAEFRYMFPVFCCLPFVLPLAFKKTDEQ